MSHGLIHWAGYRRALISPHSRTTIRNGERRSGSRRLAVRRLLPSLPLCGNRSGRLRSQPHRHSLDESIQSPFIHSIRRLSLSARPRAACGRPSTAAGAGCHSPIVSARSQWARSRSIRSTPTSFMQELARKISLAIAIMDAASCARPTAARAGRNSAPRLSCSHLAAVPASPG